jgi:hypothetical protein
MHNVTPTMDVGGVTVARMCNRLAFARNVFDDDVFRFSGGCSELLISSSAALARIVDRRADLMLIEEFR